MITENLQNSAQETDVQMATGSAAHPAISSEPPFFPEHPSQPLEAEPLGLVELGPGPPGASCPRHQFGDDWQIESAKMGATYHNASLVISASWSANGKSELFNKRKSTFEVHGDCN